MSNQDSRSTHYLNLAFASNANGGHDSTNCLVRGGDCGYPEPNPASASGAASGGAGSRSNEELTESQRQLRQLGQRLSRVLSATPSDPFDVLPIEMPHRSMELFHHCTFVPSCHVPLLSLPPHGPRSYVPACLMGVGHGDEDRMAALRAPFQLVQRHPLVDRHIIR